MPQGNENPNKDLRKINSYLWRTQSASQFVSSKVIIKISIQQEDEDESPPWIRMTNFFDFFTLLRIFLSLNISSQIRRKRIFLGKSQSQIQNYVKKKFIHGMHRNRVLNVIINFKNKRSENNKNHVLSEISTIFYSSYDLIQH